MLTWWCTGCLTTWNQESRPGHHKRSTGPGEYQWCSGIVHEQSVPPTAKEPPTLRTYHVSGDRLTVVKAHDARVIDDRLELRVDGRVVAMFARATWYSCVESVDG